MPLTYPGTLILFKLCCPYCGSPLPNYQTNGSDFFLIECSNPDCDMSKSSVLVERRTGTVLSVNTWEYRDHDGQWWRQVYEKVPAPQKEGE